MDPIGFIGLAGSMWWLDVVRNCPTRTSSATPRASPRTLIDKDSETLAVCRNGPLSRVGSVASVVATTSRIAIQGVVILDEPHSRQSLVQIFFREGCGNFCGRRRDHVAMTTMIDLFKTATIDNMRVVLGHGASGDAASMKPYVVGFKRRGIDAIAVDLPRGGAEKAVPIFIKTSGRGHEVVGGGQSFGGRVASMAAVEADFGGLVLFSYPLHRPGFPDQLRTEHWPQIRCPTLFLSGDRDPFARIELLQEKIKLIPNARLEIFKGQGHGLLAVLDQALDVATDFLSKNIK